MNKKIYKEPIKEEMETTINVIYEMEKLCVYTNKVNLQKQLNKLLGEPTKEYKIRIKLDMADDATIKWSDRLNNPLGVRVSEYVVESGNGDPLDTGYLATDAQ